MSRGILDWLLEQKKNIHGKPGEIQIKPIGQLTVVAWDFPGGPVDRGLSFHCRGHRFDPWSGN